MPKVNVTVPHNMDPQVVKEKAGPMMEKTIQDFQGHDLEIDWNGMTANFRFKSLAFTIRGTVRVEPDQVAVEVDLPFAAMMYKDRVQKGISKNLTRALAIEP